MPKNAFMAGGSAPDPNWGTFSAPQSPDLLIGGEGATNLLPKDPIPALGFRSRFSAIRASVRASQLQFLATPVIIRV